MGRFKQVDGNKTILVAPDGSLREGLRNIEPVYSYNDEGEISNEWPRVVINIDEDGEEDVRSLPELVLKTHGNLPPNMKCSESDFEPTDGNKLNCSIENIEYVGEARVNPQRSPYKTRPAEPKQQDETPTPEPKNVPPPEPEPEDEFIPEETPEEELPPIAKGSAELLAKDAVDVIKSYDFDELADAGFYTEDDREDGPRTTVKEAWEKKEKEFYEANAE